MCWGVGEVRGDVGKGEGSEVREEMWGSVLRPHTLTHFHTPPPFLSPHPFSTRQHTFPLTPYTLPHFSSALPTHLSLPAPTPQHTSLHLPPHPPHTSFCSSPYLPLHHNTLPHSPHALSHTSPHIFPLSFDYVAKLPSDNVTLINLTGKA